MSGIRDSFVQGLAAEPLRYETIGNAFDHTVAEHAHREALIVRHQNVRWTYSELHARVNRLAAGLVHLGLKPGDRIGIWAPNCAEWLLTQLASAKAGLILVNLNPAYRSTELEFSLNKVGCRAIVLAGRLKGNDFLTTLRALAPEMDDCPVNALASARLPELRCVISLEDRRHQGCLWFPQVLQMGERQDREHLRTLADELQPDDAINIQFTSGTTGLPKGATLSHFNILNNGFFVGRALDLHAGDRMCIPVPLYHCFGMVMGNLACITHGATMVYPAEWFDPEQTLAAIQEEKCAVLYGVPTMFIAQLEHPHFARYTLTSLRTGIMSGAPCPMEVMKRVVSDMHLPKITIAYGMTETSPVSFQTSATDSIENRVSSVGRVHPHVQVKLVDPSGRVVPRGSTGEVLTRGYSVMKGYWADSERTRDAIDESGWMHTGDLAVLDAEGYCSVTGRLKDMLIRGGENIYPREIEEFLYRHPKVQAVQVFGVPDRKYGEQVCAWIQLRRPASATTKEIRDFCRGQIADHKIPYYMRFVSEFPVTVTGKPQKYLMREQMIAILAADDRTSAPDGGDCK
jgi:fatty-acyl-CoA synthase